MKRLTKSVLSLAFLLPSLAFSYDLAPSEKLFYLTIDGGVTQNTFNLKYIDQSDVIAQNIADTVLQKGYTGAIGIGVSKIYCQNYLLGLEFSGGWSSNNATFESGALSNFTDKVSLKNYIDLVLVPGILFTNSLAGYVKLGASAGNFSDTLNTPVGYTPVYVNSSSSKYTAGFTGSIGLKKWITPDFALFAEYNYRDYGTISYPNFTNYTATYTHKIRAYSDNVLLGLSYQFI